MGCNERKSARDEMKLEKEFNISQVFKDYVRELQKTFSFKEREISQSYIKRLNELETAKIQIHEITQSKIKLSNELELKKIQIHEMTEELKILSEAYKKVTMGHDAGRKHIIDEMEHEKCKSVKINHDYNSFIKEIRMKNDKLMGEKNEIIKKKDAELNDLKNKYELLETNYNNRMCKYEGTKANFLQLEDSLWKIIDDNRRKSVCISKLEKKIVTLERDITEYKKTIGNLQTDVEMSEHTNNEEIKKLNLKIVAFNENEIIIKEMSTELEDLKTKYELSEAISDYKTSQYKKLNQKYIENLHLREKKLRSIIKEKKVTISSKNKDIDNDVIVNSKSIDSEKKIDGSSQMVDIPDGNMKPSRSINLKRSKKRKPIKQHCCIEQQKSKGEAKNKLINNKTQRQNGEKNSTSSSSTKINYEGTKNTIFMPDFSKKLYQNKKDFYDDSPMVPTTPVIQNLERTKQLAMPQKRSTLPIKTESEAFRVKESALKYEVTERIKRLAKPRPMPPSN